MKSVFNSNDVQELLGRLNKIQAGTKPEWGTMDAAKMFAHCNVTYEMAYENKHEKPGAIARFMLKLFVKNQVVGSKPYAKNGRTAPQFIIKDEKDFEAEKTRLVAYINKTLDLGAAHFEQKESHSFGKLPSSEWNTMFYKHLNHHLTQFGV